MEGAVPVPYFVLHIGLCWSMLVLIKPTMERAQEAGSTFFSSRLGTERDDHSNTDAQRQFAIPVVIIDYTGISIGEQDFYTILKLARLVNSERCCSLLLMGLYLM